MQPSSDSLLPCDFADHVVLYLDILGFKKLVYESEYSQDACNTIRKLIHEFWEVTQLDEKTASNGQPQAFRSTSFSDLFFCSQPIENVHSIFNIVNAAILNQRELAKYGFLARGAITVGPLYQATHGVFGPALIEAVEIEKHDAVYPRVILSKAAVDKWKEYCSRECPHDSMIDHRYKMIANSRVRIQQDADGWWSTAYLSYLPSSRASPASEFELFRPTIIDLLKKSPDDPHIRAKYQWLRNEWNTSVKRTTELVVEKLLIHES